MFRSTVFFVALGACRRYYYDLELLRGKRS